MPDPSILLDNTPEFPSGHMIRAMKDAVLLVETDGTIADCNDNARKLLAPNAPELVGLRIAELIDAASQDALQDALYSCNSDAALSDTRNIAVVKPLHASADHVLLELSLSNWVDVTQRRFIVIVRDVSEPNRQADELRLYKAALESVKNATVITDATGTILWVNNAFLRCTGYTREEVIGANPRILKSGEHDQLFYEKLWARILSGKPWSGTVVNRRKDGTLYPESQTITPILDASGVISHFTAAKQEITDLVTMRRLLQRSTSRYARLFKHSPLALLEEDCAELKRHLDDLRNQGITDFRRYFIENPSELARCAELIHIIDANDTALRLYGCTSKQELFGKLNTFMVEESYDDLRELLVRLIDGALNYKGEVRNGTLHGQPVILEMNLSIAPQFADCWSEVIVSLEDISERKQREHQLAHAMKMEAVGQLTGGVAHDFNNVLTVVSGNLRLVLDLYAESLSDDILEMLTDAASAADDGAKLTSRLLAFSRKAPLEESPVDVAEVLAEFAELANRTLGREVQVYLDMATVLPTIKTDRSAMTSALLNLALNARDAMPEGGALYLKARLGDSAADQDTPPDLPARCVIVEVRDTGYGMPPDVVARATDPFFTTKGADRGSGLGLSMVYDFVKASHGQLQIESHVGVGTSIRMSFPVE